MPQAVPLIVGSVAAQYGAYFFGSQLVAAVIGGAVAFGTTKLLGLDEVPKMDDPGVKANIRSTVAPIPIVYGRRRVGGVLAQAVTSGEVLSSQKVIVGGAYDGWPRADTSQTDNKYLNLILCWAEGEIEGVDLLWFNDNLSTRTEYAGFFTVEHFTGTDDQTASALFLTALARTYTPDTVATLWSTNHRLRGVAYTYIQLKYNAKAWAGGIPAITADIKGRKVLDVRDSSTAWSDNPALCIYDYLTNTRFGRGIDPAEIDTQSFIEAANYCDQDIFIQTGGDGILEPIVGVTQARYTCDAILNPDQTALDNLRILLGTCRGALVFSGGLYKLKLDKPEVSTFNLTADNIVGGWNILLENSQSRFNRIHAQWINKALHYQEDIAILESPTFLAADNDEVLEAKIDLPATTNPYRPIQMAGMALRQSRYSLQCEVTCTIEGLACEVFDVISVTHETPGWTNQLFRVMAITLESDDHVRLQLTQYADDVYDLDSQNDEDSPPPTGLPDPRIVTDIELFNAAIASRSNGDGTTRYLYRMSWATLIPSINLGGFNLRWRETADTGWQSTVIIYNDEDYTPGRFHYYDLNVRAGITHEVEIEAFNSLGVKGNTYTVSLSAITPVPI